LVSSAQLLLLVRAIRLLESNMVSTPLVYWEELIGSMDEWKVGNKIMNQQLLYPHEFNHSTRTRKGTGKNAQQLQ
jgi:hypothetical protein